MTRSTIKILSSVVHNKKKYKKVCITCTLTGIMVKNNGILKKRFFRLYSIIDRVGRSPEFSLFFLKLNEKKNLMLPLPG